MKTERAMYIYIYSENEKENEGVREGGREERMDG